MHIYQYAKAFETGTEFEGLSIKILSKVKNLLLFGTLCPLQPEIPTDEIKLFFMTVHVQIAKPRYYGKSGLFRG